MSNVFSEISMSLDGFIAGPNAEPDNPLGDGGTDLHQWVYELASWRERQGLEGGTVNQDDELVRASFERTGAYVMGRRMFDEGEVGWSNPPPFHAPVFVVTHEERVPWVREGGTTFTFVTNGIDRALERAQEAADGKDIQVAGGAHVIQQFLNAGLIDEFTVHIAPVFLGGGVRLFDDIDTEHLSLEKEEVLDSLLVTHIAYRVDT